MVRSQDLEIYFHYLGEEVVPGRKYDSPFRSDGMFPSLSFKIIDDVLCWKDFGGLEENPSIVGKKDGLAFIMQYENFTNRFQAARHYQKVIKNGTPKNKEFKIKQNDRKDPILEIRTEWKDFELEYWKDIDRSLLKPNLIFPNQLYDSGFVQISSTELSPSFVYLFSAEANSWKVYTPFNREHKFKSNNVRDVIEGWDQLPQSGENLVISKATKDRLVNLTYLNTSCINPFSENAYNSLIRKSKELNSRFRNIFVSLDADKTGQLQTYKICEKTNWKPVFKPLWYKDNGMKDDFDILSKYGSGVLLEIYRKHKLPLK